ncbi:TPA: hypothetical protein ENX78_00545 [Candidatus Poribacteria bacterium]|nr:hypothetical protein [Candidatus Poribacteria bacterium]
MAYSRSYALVFWSALLFFIIFNSKLVSADSPTVDLYTGRNYSQNDKVVRREYRWEDINSAQVIQADQDQFIIDARVPLRNFRVELMIPRSQIIAAVRDFGIPEDWLQIKYRNEEELRIKKKILISQAAAKGITFDPNRNLFSVDYKWVISRSHNDVLDTFKKLLSIAQKADYRDTRKLLGLFASFVQSLEYKQIPVTRKNDDGKYIFVAGVTMPIETLANGFGDCDTKCLLFGSLLSHLKNTKMILVQGGNHVFAGINIVPKPGDRYVRIRNENYVLVELTSPWLLGHIPDENWRGLRMKKFEIITLF